MIRNLPIIVSTDNSPSAKNKWRYIKPGLYDLLAGLAERNHEDVDVHRLVELCTFNDHVEPLTGNCVLEPEKVLEMVSRPGDEDTLDLPEDVPYVENNELFRCKGLTDIGALCDYLDMRLTRGEGGLIPDKESPDYAPILVIVTDLMHTTASSMDAPWKKLHRNKFFQACKKIVVFFGPENRAAAAQELAGGAENVITLNDNIIDHLAQILFDSVILNSDSTHLEGADQTPQEIGDEIKDKINKGKKSVEELNETERLMNEVNRLLYPSLVS